MKNPFGDHPARSLWLLVLGVVVALPVDAGSERSGGLPQIEVSFEDSGTSALGHDIWGLGLRWNDIAGSGHAMGYRFNRTGKKGGLEAHGVNYRVPLEEGRGLLLGARYAEVSDKVVDVDPRARSDAYWLRLELPLGEDDSPVTQRLRVGMDYKNYNNDLIYFGDAVYDNFVKIIQLVASYSAVRPDESGINQWFLHFVASPGGLGRNNQTSRFEAARTNAEANYHRIQLGFERHQRLRHGYAWVVRSRIQQTDSRLLPSEQMALGGRTSIRGFNERDTGGDNGYWLSNELRSPHFELPGIQGPSLGDAQLLMFADWGRASTVQPEEDEFSHRALASVGFGVRYQWREHLQVEGDFGWQVAGRYDDISDQARTHWRVSASF
ncbi:ShlB/FhaC/HecB family hemolysin secretion/activation protein [Marinimicrobium alkaliphilum]|uniref:ShlB/FhaC/HecB family hemolysin secretion/activation protein n=1 Tax=Marinimicrobium alkaliphilum TaxID=2202654 RepID=UPI000DBAB501|nr:ShlB/FhaC/HecB family hemolysin secretion/activation protein [Marinimicrobium alkaliphilum]